jgi:phospho-N-acetylmuramoyl-pentapeptide-transferase
MLEYFLFPLADEFIFFNLLKYITVRAGGALVTALVLSWLIGPFLIEKFRILQKKGNTVREDLPERHAATKSGTPSMGGFLVMVTLFASTVLWMNLENSLVWIALWVAMAFGFLGFVDDWLKITGRRRGGVPGKIRLLVGTLISVTALYGYTFVVDDVHNTSLFVPFLKDTILPLGLFGFLVFGTLVLVGSANAVNLTDGLDGLATGPTVIAAGSLAIIAYVVGRVDFTGYLNVFHVAGAGELTVFCAALIGACLGFLWYNAPPARIFMGDTGSLAMGASLGIVAVFCKVELVLAIIGGLFVVETLSVMIQVASFKLRKKRVFAMAPLHHHFEKKGWPESTIVIRFWIISFLCALAGLATLKLR